MVSPTSLWKVPFLLQVCTSNPPSASCPWEEGGRLEKGVPRSLERRLTYMKMEYHFYQLASDRSLGSMSATSLRFGLLKKKLLQVWSDNKNEGLNNHYELPISRFNSSNLQIHSKLRSFKKTSQANTQHVITFHPPFPSLFSHPRSRIGEATSRPTVGCEDTMGPHLPRSDLRTRSCQGLRWGRCAFLMQVVLPWI